MAVDFKTMDEVFNPKTVVVIGDKGPGFMWLNANRAFKGNLYSVQIDPNEIAGIERLGVRNFTSLADVPEPVDFAIVAVPRAVAGRILADCIQNMVKGCSLFTSGFAETSTAEGIEGQRQIVAIAKDSGIVLVGPNCMGLHNPSLGLCFGQAQPLYEGGTVGFSSQSGSHANGVIAAASENGIKLSKVVSFGNGVLLENADYLEYLAQDPQTEVIGMYVEGLRDGRRFFNLLKQTTPKKPVVIWKGGQTTDGQRATSSHTASLAESMAIWRAVARQTGVILVNGIEELIDTFKALLLLPKFTGTGCALTGGAGGQSVSITDAFAKAGMSVPALSDASYEKLGAFFSLVGASYRNPIDAGSNRREMDAILDILNEDPAIQVIVQQVGVRVSNPGAAGQPPQAADGPIESFLKLKEKSAKALAAVVYSLTPHRDAERLKELEDRFQSARIPTFPSYERAARALRNVADYHRFNAEV